MNVDKALFGSAREKVDVMSQGFSSWLRQTLWSLRGVYRDVLLASFLLNLFVLATPLYIMNVYDRVVPNQAEETLWVLTFGLVLVLGFDLMIRLGRHFVIELAGRQVEQVLSKRLFSHVLNLRTDHIPASVGAFANQLREFEAIRHLLSASSLAALADLPFALLFLVVIWSVGGALVWIPLIAVSAMLLFASLTHFRLKPHIRDLQQHNTEKHAVLIESISGLETLKAFSAHSRQQSAWADSVSKVAESTLKIRRLADAIPLVSGFFAQTAVAGVVVAGVYQIFAQELSLGGLIATVLLTGRAMGPATQAINLMSLWHQARQAFAMLQSLSVKPVDRPEGKQWLSIAQARGLIEVKSLDFAYQDTQPVFQGLNLRINAGEKVALIGRIGSGKSTLLRLFGGLLRASRGMVTLDGIGIDHIDPKQLRRQFALVPQDITLFRGSLRDNICLNHELYGESEMVQDSSILKAIERAGLSDFVAAHPMGLDMPIGEHGKGLSGGQRQSIAVARALIGAPPVLLFDELTSAMDNQSEQYVLSQIRELANDRTLILATHRSALLNLVDRIIVLDAGKVVADGPKADVLEALKRGLVGQV